LGAYHFVFSTIACIFKRLTTSGQSFLHITQPCLCVFNTKERIVSPLF
jgi:hypothetical protein